MTGDSGKIKAALQAALDLSLEAKHTSKATVNYYCDDIDYTVQLIVSNMVDAVVVDESYLIVFAIVTPWYSKNRTVFVENLLLRIGDQGSFDRAVDVMEHLADINQCDSMSAGGALARHPRAISRMYKRRGFELELHAPQLTKLRS